MARRDGTPRGPDAEENPRYVEGQRIYLDTCHPAALASIVIDNNVLGQPRIIR